MQIMERSVVFLFQRATSSHIFSAIVPGNIELSLCQTANACGTELADKLMATEAHDILAEAKEQTAKAVLEEKARKEKEASGKARQAAAAAGGEQPVTEKKQAK